ncbi:hypothetical protein P692DRAFT_20709990 [Suillus brevipes Sb2]|nr:hypothetical protein P692DRAFT_20709990 [Suillus brevipes Sb2]
MGATHSHSSPSALFARLTSRLFRFRHDNAEAHEPPQLPALSGLHPRALFARLSPRLHRSPPQNNAPNELQQPSTPSRSRPDAVMDLLSSLFRSQHRTNEKIELSQRATPLHVVDVAPMRDREVCIPLVSASGV